MKKSMSVLGLCYKTILNEITSARLSFFYFEYVKYKLPSLGGIKDE
ncbi:hypothetical protein C7437_1011410 [Psychrobacillus insolitus]|uniref:Uncharacterized protein n=1 Tax=Psychrobacillus insolitus TaxID=1461 RepID=A0A2W7PIT9_9BACI|nr:hypothetical protein C7437_1011410 [Psychrobacillus insolitus]